MAIRTVDSHATKPLAFHAPLNERRIVQVSGGIFKAVAPHETRNPALRLIACLKSGKPDPDEQPTGLRAWVYAKLNAKTVDSYIRRMQADLTAGDAMVMCKGIRERFAFMPPVKLAHELSRRVAQPQYILMAHRTIDSLDELQKDLVAIAEQDPSLRYVPEGQRTACVKQAIRQWRTALLANPQPGDAPKVDHAGKFIPADVMPYLQAEARKLQDARTARTARAEAAKPAAFASDRAGIERAATLLRINADKVTARRVTLKALTNVDRQAIVDKAARMLAKAYPQLDVARTRVALARLAAEPQLETRWMDVALANLWEAPGAGMNQMEAGTRLAAMIDAIVCAPQPKLADPAAPRPIQAEAVTPGSILCMQADGTVGIIAPRRAQADKHGVLLQGSFEARYRERGLIAGRPLKVDLDRFDFSAQRPMEGANAGKEWISPDQQLKNLNANGPVVAFLRARLHSDMSVPSHCRVSHGPILDRACLLPPPLFAMVVAQLMRAELELPIALAAKVQQLRADGELMALLRRNGVTSESQQQHVILDGLRRALRFEEDHVRLVPRSAPKVRLNNDDPPEPKPEHWRSAFVQEALAEYLHQQGVQLQAAAGVDSNPGNEAAMQVQPGANNVNENFAHRTNVAVPAVSPARPNV